MQTEGTSTSEPREALTQHSLILRLHDWEDKRSWNAFYRKYYKLVYAVARQSGLNEAEAWDAVQETFLTIARQSQRREGDYDPTRGSFKAWLLHITRWRIHDQLRRRRPEEDAATMSLLENATEEGFESIWESEWRQNLMRVAVSRIKSKVSPRQFQIFEYHVLQGMAAEEVCRKLGVNTAQVYLAKHRVGMQLRHEITELQAEEQ